jgi:hypothetical protein
VSFGEGRADTRRQLGLPALRSAAADETALSHVLQHLVEHRLITVDGDDAADFAFVLQTMVDDRLLTVDEDVAGELAGPSQRR